MNEKVIALVLKILSQVPFHQFFQKINLSKFCMIPLFPCGFRAKIVFTPLYSTISMPCSRFFLRPFKPISMSNRKIFYGMHVIKTDFHFICLYICSSHPIDWLRHQTIAATNLQTPKNQTDTSTTSKKKKLSHKEVNSKVTYYFFCKKRVISFLYHFVINHEKKVLKN